MRAAGEEAGNVARIRRRLQRLGGAASGHGAAATAAGASSKAVAGGPAEEAGGSDAARRNGKLTFAERRELAGLPDELEALEREQHALTERMCRADYHQQGAEAIKADRTRAEEIEHALARKFERWEELDRRNGGGTSG